MQNNLRVAAACALMALTLPACAVAPSPTTYTLVPVWTNGQDLPGLDSRTTLESRRPGSIVSIRADEQLAGFGASFAVAIQNKSGGVLGFSPSDIKASANGKTLRVLAANELSAEMRGRVRGFINASVRTGPKDIASASEEANRDYRFNNFGGCPAGRGDCQVFSDDTGRTYRQDRIDRQLDADTVAAAAVQLQASEEWISRRALHAFEVAPGELNGGIFVVELPPNGARIDLRIGIDGADHAFAFLASPTAAPVRP